jgi:hypothetical protein
MIQLLYGCFLLYASSKVMIPLAFILYLLHLSIVNGNLCECKVSRDVCKLHIIGGKWKAGR